MADIDALVARLKALSGPDREVDAELDAYLFGGRPSHTFTEDGGGARLRRSYGPGTVFLNPDPNDNGGHVLLRHHRTPGLYTASLDAAVALVERKLPGAFYHLAKGRLTASEPLYAAQLLFGSEQVLGEGEGPSLPIALCIALLSALSHSSSKGESDNG